MKLHIGNLPKNVTDTELNQMISTIAQPTSVEIVRDHAGASKGFGFAEFASDDEAHRVIEGMNGRDLSGQALKLAEAKARKADAPRAPRA